MNPGLILKLIFIIVGAFLLGLAVSSLAKRKMNETFCLLWFIMSIAFVLAGILLNPHEWNKYISYTGMFLILVVFSAAVYALYFISLKISELARKNQELSIQVALLNQENDRLLERMTEICDCDVRDL